MNKLIIISIICILACQAKQNDKQILSLKANQLSKDILDMVSLSSSCSNHGYQYLNKCYCLDQYTGSSCSQDQSVAWYDNPNTSCDDLVNRVDHLFNLNPQKSYADDDFFPIHSGDSIGKGKAAYGEKGDTWIPMTTVSDNFKIFNNNKISPFDVNQGALGDCYLLASLVALAGRDQGKDIFNMFYTKQDNQNHIFATRWFIDGKATFVTVDDEEPGKEGESSFSHNRNDQFWVQILEKAWAKIYGTYMKIEGGQEANVWNAITGCSTDSKETQSLSISELHQLLKTYFANNWVVGAGTYHDKTQTNLVGGHAYAILGVYTVNSQGQEVTLVKCYNPWGRATWMENPWAMGSQLWTTEIANQVGHVDGRKVGQFFLTIEDIKANFQSIYVGQIRDGYTVVSQDIPLQYPVNSAYQKYTVQVQNSGSSEFIISVPQVSMRFFKSQQCQLPFKMNYGFYVTPPGGSEGGRSDWEGGQMTVFQDIKSPQQGTYSLAIYVINQNTNYHRYFTVSIYAKQGTVTIENNNGQVQIEPTGTDCGGCSNHGVCNTATGICTCDYGWQGSDCSTGKKEKKIVKQCDDKVDNCSQYESVCTKYRAWALINCKSYCGLDGCKKVKAVVQCKDKANCSDYGASVCTNYKGWATTNCVSYCGFNGCPATSM